MKKLAMCLVMIMAVCMFAGCGDKDKKDESITVVTREDGSGTRGAFIELLGIEQKDADGKKVDNTIDTAEETNSTSVMLTTIAGNSAAIGYVSLGSMSDTVKALKVDGVEATVDNVKNGTYKVARPFHIATLENVSELAQDFIDYIMSEEGQKIVEDAGYVSQGNTGAYAGTQVSGTLKIAGSSSVTPVMEKLAEAYKRVNANATLEITQSDSSNGMSSTIEGVCEIGMASRDLKDSELAAGLKATVIAMDGIAVIVNKDNSHDDITADQIMKIYTGEITKWAELD